MNIDIANHIERLLFLHDTLVVPGLGGFTATRTSASVDYATNTIHPPAKTLTFSENLATDDGILVEDIAHTYGLSLEEARRIVDEFVQQTQAKLDQRDIVNLPGVGRLYKNYLQKIQFLPDTTNFNAGAYGLPPLQFSPIARSRETAAAPEPASAVATNTTPPAEVAAPLVPPMPPLPNPPSFDSTTPPPQRTSAGRFGLGIGIGLILCTAIFGVWWWQYRKDRPTPTLQEQLAEMEQAKPVSPLPDIAGLGQAAENAQKQQQPKTSPSLPEIEEPDLDDEVTANAEERRKALERLQKEDQRTTTTKTQPAGQRSRQCILIVATLSNPENADRLAAQLQNAGYTVYEHQRGRGRQVGISFYYTDPREIEQKKAELQQLTGEKSIHVKAK